MIFGMFAVVLVMDAVLVVNKDVVVFKSSSHGKERAILQYGLFAVCMMLQC